MTPQALMSTRAGLLADASIVLGIPLLTFLVAYYQPLNGAANWLAIMLILAASLVFLGRRVTGNWRGFLIDRRSMVSLSRFQFLIWTVVVLSAFMMAVFTNISRGAVDPLAVAIPVQLWLLMGISTASLVGSPMVLGAKTERMPLDLELTQTSRQRLQQIGVVNQELDNEGLVIKNPNPNLARFSDMFKGEETGNAATLDIAKVQMFYFTLILAVTYGASLVSMFNQPLDTIAGLPPLPESMLTLFGLSHTAYLSGKTIKHSREEPVVPG